MTHEQRLIERVVNELADGSQTVAAGLLGVSQPTMSLYLSGHREPRRSVVLLAELLLVSCTKPLLEVEGYFDPDDVADPWNDVEEPHTAWLEVSRNQRYGGQLKVRVTLTEVAT